MKTSQIILSRVFAIATLLFAVLSFSACNSVPTMVDLGLPSGLKWASFNLGASSPEDYGDYYAWGETKPKSNYSWETYMWCNGSYVSLTKYNTMFSHGTVDNKTVLDADDDVAHVKLGGRWRMPTDAEWAELRDNCTWTRTTLNGINGWLVTSNKNGASIFLPAAGGRGGGPGFGIVGAEGYYWSSSLNTGYPDFACGVDFGSGVVRYGGSRCVGRSVRPVSE